MIDLNNKQFFDDVIYESDQFGDITFDYFMLHNITEFPIFLYDTEKHYYKSVQPNKDFNDKSYYVVMNVIPIDNTDDFKLDIKLGKFKENEFISKVDLVTVNYIDKTWSISKEK